MAAEHVKTIVKYLPAHHDVIREMLIVLGGALLAALIVRQLPPNIRQYFTMQQGENQP